MAQSLPTALSTPAAGSAPRRRLPQELSILLVLIGIALCFEVLGWIVRDRSFLYNPQGLLITILQVSEIGLLAIGVTLVIIAGGIDLSSGSVVALSAMVAASLAQMSDVASAVYPALTDLPAVVPIAAGLIVGALAGLLNGALIVTTGIPAFIVTLGMMVSARGLARFYTHGQPVSMLTDSYLWLGSGAKPVAVFLGAALIFHVLLRYTRFGKCVYAIGGNPVAARVSGINLNGTLVMVYTLAGLLAGLGGVIASSRAQTGQSGMGMSYELDAIAAAVIGGTSLSGGVGRITGTVIGALILGVISSGFTFLGVDAYIQEIIKGAIIVVAVVADRFRKRKRG
ncbi:ABC transporter permease [Ralstonia syzygii subsp. celebesensis]|uniref:ABC transporter permease n=3 Tax=Ralstonia solanacearum species complex TaxID=3116862 RepID=A0AAD0SEC1_RALSL|nr:MULTISPECIES: ABC transporter permease [Ralstonia solanacearum species complex]CCA79147.1 putative sugar transmembrane abc transporter protein (rbsC) [blood disease bacterium R229]AQW28893.1 ABC transporter [blood disease bacterium A2-HR MARDI]AXV81862.1 ABC transporter permease [Ralstonia solanacearum]AXW52996.1 ABC transporter permease [Ralstonia solanacearum]QQV54559.1 ABC transporter permease [Ralstonia syzygii subsp. celebesensis]